VALYGVESDTLATTYTYRNVTRGLIYRARYRVRNAIGWSDYSPMGYLKAAIRPSAPPAPGFIAATANSIMVKLGRSEDNGGAEISAYELWIDGGELLSQFSKVASYSGLEASFVIDRAVETSLVSGKVYRLKYRAKNEIGHGDYSGVTTIAMADKPPQVAAPAKNQSLST
jgi:hypothetical protein